MRLIRQPSESIDGWLQQRDRRNCQKSLVPGRIAAAANRHRKQRQENQRDLELWQRGVDALVERNSRIAQLANRQSRDRQPHCGAEPDPKCADPAAEIDPSICDKAAWAMNVSNQATINTPCDSPMTEIANLPLR